MMKPGCLFYFFAGNRCKKFFEQKSDFSILLDEEMMTYMRKAFDGDDAARLQ